MTLFGVLVVSFIYFIPTDVFKFILGDNDWVKVGLYIKIISLSFVKIYFWYG